MREVGLLMVNTGYRGGVFSWKSPGTWPCTPDTPANPGTSGSESGPGLHPASQGLPTRGPGPESQLLHEGHTELGARARREASRAPPPPAHWLGHGHVPTPLHPPTPPPTRPGPWIPLRLPAPRPPDPRPALPQTTPGCPGLRSFLDLNIITPWVG